MANWKQTLDISDLWDDVCEDESRVGELCTAIADRLEALIPDAAEQYQIDRLKRFIDDFRDLADDEPHFAAFNYIFEDLYDWGDRDHNLWIKTF